MIYDEDLVLDFFSRQIDLEPTEVFIVLAGARKKYDVELLRSYEVAFRDMIKNNVPERFLFRLKKIALSMSELYDFTSQQRVDTQKAGTLYFKPNPVDVVKGYHAFQQKMNQLMYEATKNSDVLEQFKDIDRFLFSEIHKAKGRRFCFLIDVDTKQKEVLKFLIDTFRDYILWVTETRGGYHIIYRKEGNKIQRTDKNFTIKLLAVVNTFCRTRELKKIVEFKRADNFVTPVWGCLQGGFKVREYEFRPSKVSGFTIYE